MEPPQTAHEPKKNIFLKPPTTQRTKINEEPKRT